MTKEELTNWFESDFWPQYRNLTKTPVPTQYGAGAKGEALKRIIMMKPSAALRERIALAVQAQTIHRKKLFEQAGSIQSYNEKTKAIKFYCNRGGGTWLFQMGYEDDIPSLTEEEGYETYSTKCNHEGCSNKTHGPDFQQCVYHIPEADKTMVQSQRDYLRGKGLSMISGESMKDYALRCRQHLASINPLLYGRINSEKIG